MPGFLLEISLVQSRQTLSHFLESLFAPSGPAGAGKLLESGANR